VKGERKYSIANNIQNLIARYRTHFTPRNKAPGAKRRIYFNTVGQTQLNQKQSGRVTFYESVPKKQPLQDQSKAKSMAKIQL
jgi:hypothetical protein